MRDNKNPLSPHLQVYRWHISSLLSITHRIVGAVNLLALTLIFFWLLILSFGESNYELFLFFRKKAQYIGFVAFLFLLDYQLFGDKRCISSIKSS